MSSSSETSSIATSLARPAQARRSSIEINIDGHYHSKVYTSGSPIAGEVIVTPWRDMRFDYLQIVLLGTTKTRLDAIQVPQHASHTFLKLSMPVPETAYPVPRIFEAGRSYSFAFNFIVPSYLTMSACNHPAQSDVIHDQHMRLPPSMGPSRANGGERNDLAPDMTQVEYAIKARVLAEPEVDDPLRRPVRLMENQFPVQVLPASIEDPPLGVTKNDRAYCLTKTKSLRKSLFSSKIGRMTATAVQPAAVALSPDGRTVTRGSTATVSLEFEPTSADVPPPKVNAVSAKLVATTYFSATPMTRLPNMGPGRSEFGYDQRLSYQTSVSLFSTQVEKVTWRQQITAQARRDSGYSSGSNSNNRNQGGAASDDEDVPTTAATTSRSLKTKTRTAAPIFHTATLAIPFKLPSSGKKLFLPTFHSCLVSRTYTLSLSLNVGSNSTSITLLLPLQIVIDGVAAGHQGSIDMGLPSFDAAVAQQEADDADEHLRPRRLTIPAPEFQGTSVLPGYDEMAGFRRLAVRAT